MQKLKTFFAENRFIMILIMMFMFWLFIDLQGFAIMKDAMLQFKANFEAKYFVFPSVGD